MYIVDGKGKEIECFYIMRSSVGSVKHNAGKRRDLVAHFAVNHFTLASRHPTMYTSLEMTLGEFGVKFMNNVLICVW